jgi:hypothetical protein
MKIIEQIRKNLEEENYWSITKEEKMAQKDKIKRRYVV